MYYTNEETARRFLNMVVSVGQISQETYQYTKPMYSNYSKSPGNLSTPEAVLAEIQLISPEIHQLSGHPNAYLQGMLDAYALHGRMLQGDSVDYVTACKILHQVDIAPMEGIEVLAEEIQDALGKTPILEWLHATRIPQNQVIETAKSLVEKSKKSTVSKVIALPENDEIAQVNGVTDVYWSGSSAYQGDGKGVLTFNIEKPWSLPTFASIVCHEAYPGHQAFASYWDASFQNGTFPLEGAFYATVGNPTTAMYEGVPEIGLHLLGWDDLEEDTPEITEEEKRQFALGQKVLRLQRMVQQEGCYRHNVEGQPRSAVVDWMTAQKVFTPLEAENSFTFFADPMQKHYYPAYYYGTILLERLYQTVPKNKRKDFFVLLYGKPHTTQTLRHATAKLTGREICW